MINKAWILTVEYNDELGKNYYEYCARGWPKPIGWENLGEGTQYLWIERALKILGKDKPSS